MKSKCLAVVIALLVLGMAVQTADAQTRKSGVNSAAFLKVGVGARQVALGSAATSFTGDVSNMFWNPAGIALQNEMMQASFTHNNWIAGLQQEVAAVSYNLEDIGTFGVGFMTFGISDIPAELKVDADRDQLFRVLSNLCRNAVQALESDADGMGEIVITARREGSVTLIDVRDTGPGVSERAKAHLFQAFQSVARKGGTGLGLAIAAELVNAHGGQIMLIGNEGGATFRVIIPDVVVELQRARRRSA